jgi:hypothetical protein
VRHKCKGEDESLGSTLSSEIERGGEAEGRGGRRPCHGWPAGIAGGGAGKRQRKRRRRGHGD